MIINKLGDRIYTAHELRYLAQDEIARLFPPSVEANIQRRISGLALGLYTPTSSEMAEIEAYKTHLLAVQSEAAQAEIDNQLLISTIEYEKALARLRQYELSVGKPEKPIYTADPVTNQPVLDYTIPAIEPLNATVEQTVFDTEGNASTVTVPNPLIAEDENERVEAQGIVDAVTQDILDLYSFRLGSRVNYT